MLGRRCASVSANSTGSAATATSSTCGAPAVEGGGEQAGEPDEAGEAHGVGALVHREQLVQADAAEHEQTEREDRAALDHDEQRDGDRGQRREDAGAQVRALAGACVRHRLSVRRSAAAARRTRRATARGTRA